MHAFRNSTRRLQRFAWLTLLGWSFALASGVVNACLLSLPGRAGEGPSPSAQDEAASPAGHSGTLATHGVADHEAGPGSLHAHEQAPGSPGKDSCLKFCGDESSAAAKSTSFAVDVAAALVDSRAQRRLAVAVQVDSGSSLDPPRAQGPPLVIRFLRLTL